MRFRIAENVVSRDMADESVLLHLDTETYLGLDAIGTRLWHLLAEQGSSESAIETLLAEYDEDKPHLQRDVDTLIDQRMSKKLLLIDAEHTPSTR